MRSRFLTFSASVLLACSSGEEPEVLPGPGPSPTFEGSGDGSGNADGGPGLLAACGARQQIATCQRAERELQAGDESALRFAADDFLQLVRGEHRGDVLWELEGAPARRSQLVVTVEPSGEPRFVDQTTPPGRSNTITFGNTGGHYYTCGDQLAVDAELKVVMPDGSLNETLQATITAESDRHARILLDVPSASLVGTLRAVIEDGGSDQLSLALGISKLGSGLEGTLAARSSRGSTNVERGSSCRVLGTAQLAEGCPFGALPLAGTGELLGLSLAGALERLNATSPAVLGDTGAELSLAFSAEPRQQCVSIDTPASLAVLATFPGSVTLQSSDGRIDGTLDVQLTAEALDGVLRVVKAEQEYLVPDPSGLAQLAPSYAIQEPLSWSALEMGGFEFLVEAHEAASGGLLRAIGGQLSCESARPCEEVCPGPGCTVSPAEKWAARWGEMVLGTELSLR